MFGARTSSIPPKNKLRIPHFIFRTLYLVVHFVQHRQLFLPKKKISATTIICRMLTYHTHNVYARKQTLNIECISCKWLDCYLDRKSVTYTKLKMNNNNNPNDSRIMSIKILFSFSLLIKQRRIKRNSIFTGERRGIKWNIKIYKRDNKLYRTHSIKHCTPICMHYPMYSLPCHSILLLNT